MRELILKALQQKQYVSGEKLGQTLHISRTAVWKHINELRKKGYQIDSSPKMGYSLVKSTDLLLPEEINLGLETRIIGKRIVHYNEVSSTQDVATALARDGADEGTVVVAEAQTKGRGRKGRSWISPSDGGVYLSIILKPGVLPSQVAQIPLVAGMAVVKAIEKVTSLQPRIKWPNDVLIGSKKVAGILTEMSCEIDTINYVILGIGINVNTPESFLVGFAGYKGTSLAVECRKTISRPEFVRHLFVEFENLYTKFLKSGFGSIREEWKMLNTTIGSLVRVSDGAEEVDGKAIDIDENGFLLVKRTNGEIKRIISGDVFLRKK